MRKNQLFFAKIPYKMIEEMTGADIKLYGALFLHCFGNKSICNPGIERISEFTNLSTATIAKAQKNQKKAGWIVEVKHRYKNSNDYTIRKVNKRYAEIPKPALLLSNTTLKLYCYLTKKCKDTETTIATATIKKETGISDNRTLYPALIELHDNDLLDFPSFVCSKQIHKWKIVKTNPAKSKDQLDKNPAKSKEQENTNSAKTKVLPLQKVKGNPAKSKDKRNFFEINFYERNYIMQDGTSFFSKTGQEKSKKEKQESNIIPLAMHKKKTSSQKNIKKKVSFKKLSNKERRTIRNKYKECVFDTDRNKNNFFTAKEFSILLRKYKESSEDEKQIVDGYVNHEMSFVDTDPKGDNTFWENLFRCEWLVPENKIVPGRTILRNRYMEMTPDQRKAEIENDEVYQHKMNYLESIKDIDFSKIAPDDFKTLAEYQYIPYYSKGKKYRYAPANNANDDKEIDLLDEWGKMGKI